MQDDKLNNTKAQVFNMENSALRRQYLLLQSNWKNVIFCLIELNAYFNSNHPINSSRCALYIIIVVVVIREVIKQ